MSEQKTILVSQVLALLEKGFTRKKIAEHYQITEREVKALFLTPSLKGKKAKKTFVPSFTVQDDTVAVDAEVPNDESQDNGTDRTARPFD